MRPLFRVATLIGLGVGMLVTACSKANDDEPVDEYPPGNDDPRGSRADGGRDGATYREEAGADAPEPIVGRKLSSSAIFFRGLTGEGDLVLDVDRDLSVWPADATAPTVIVKDYDPDTDSVVVRDRFVAAWLGSDVRPSSPTVWTKATGVKTLAPKVARSVLYPKRGTSDVAYLAPSTSALSFAVKVTTLGAGEGTTVIADLDTGALTANCRPTITFAGSGLLASGCPNAATTAKVAIYALDGSGPTTTLLSGSAPGVWIDHARTHALVQTATASSIRGLATGASVPVALDGAIRQAAFSIDDTRVMYLTASGAVKRASTTAPSSPVTLAPSALSILALSFDARFAALATSGNPNDAETNLIVVDANTPGAPRTLATERARVVGFSSDGTKLAYMTDLDFGTGKLWIVTLPSGQPTLVSDAAEHEVLAGDVVYFQVFDRPAKSNQLLATRMSAPNASLEIDRGLDTLTAQVIPVEKQLFVASKLGLWVYPTLTP